MLNEILLAGIFFLGGIFVQIIGTNLADKKNHERNIKRLEKEHENKIEYLKEEIFYKRKLEYCEGLTSKIEKTKENTNKMIEDIKENKIPEVEYLLGELAYGEYSLIFEVSDLLEKVDKFKSIQHKLGEQMIKTLKEKEKKKENIQILEEMFKEMIDTSNKIFAQMRIELKRGLPILISRERLLEIKKILPKIENRTKYGNAYFLSHNP